jgi:hypothetical protein
MKNDADHTCVDCYGWTEGGCDTCHKPLCYDCNDGLNEEDQDGDGNCWKCREVAAGTYDGCSE